VREAASAGVRNTVPLVATVGGIPPVKQVGLVLAIVVDATVVHMLAGPGRDVGDGMSQLVGAGSAAADASACWAA
jgi:hypothetical protein